MKLNIFALLFVISVGCSTTRYGKVYPLKPGINLGSLLEKGQSKEDVFLKYGPPEININFKKKNFWSYKIIEGNYFLFLGNTEYKDLVVEFENDKVVNHYFFDKGKSYGMFAYPSASH